MRVFQATTSNRSYPPDRGGYQRTHGLTISFPDHGDHVFRYCCTGPVATYYAEREFIDRVVQISPGIVEERHYSLLHDVPKAMSVLGYPALLWSTVLRSKVGKILLRRATDQDLILADNPYMALFLAENTEVPTVYSSHNVEYQRYLASAAGALSEFLGGRLRRVEERASMQVDAVVCTSESDSEAFGKHARRTIVVHNGVFATRVTDTVDPADRGQHGIPADATVVAFLGTDYGPNVEAARWLVDNWPELNESYHLLVLGTAGNKINSSADNVHAPGYVEDLQATLAMCDVALNPIIRGGGSNVKLVEYFATGLPVVSTPFGATGFDVNHGEHLIITDRDGFLGAIQRLAGDEELREELGASGYRLAESRYTWESLSDRLRRQLFDELPILE